MPRIARLFLLIFLLFTNSAFAKSDSVNNQNNDDFYASKYRGWFYFEEFADDKEKAKPKNSDALFLPSNLSAVERMEQMQAALAEIKAQAIINPSVDNLLAYKRFEKRVIHQGDLFAMAGQKALLRDPSLDENVINPTAQMARPLVNRIEASSKEKKLKALAGRYGLFFYFSSNCKYCHLFAPILKMFADKYEFDVVAISVDGGGVPEFPNARIDNGSAQKYEIPVFPALILFDSRTNQIRPFHYGFATLDVLEEKIKLVDHVVYKNKGI